MSKFVNKRTVRCKVETTYNTDATPTVADSFQVASLKWTQSDAKVAERTISSGTRVPPPGVFVGSLYEVSFEAEVKGSGTAGTAPKGLGAALQAAGFKETIVAVTSVTYKVDSVADKSATIWFKDGDEDEWRLTGCRGQVTFEENAGEFTKAKFTIRGHLGQTPTNTAAWTNTYDATTPVALLNVPIVIGGITFDQSKVTIDIGNEVAAAALLNGADGFGEIRIPKRAPKLTATIFPPPAATASPLADLAANTVKTITQVVIGATGGNRYQFTFAGGGKYLSVGDGDADGVVTYDVELGLLESALGADNELSLIFT